MEYYTCQQPSQNRCIHSSRRLGGFSRCCGQSIRNNRVGLDLDDHSHLALQSRKIRMYLSVLYVNELKHIQLYILGKFKMGQRIV